MTEDEVHEWFEYWRALLRGEAPEPPRFVPAKVTPLRKDIDE